VLHTIRNLDYVVLLCRDISLMRSFYHDIMGFPVYLETTSWIEMRVGSVLLTLSKRERPFVGAPLPEGSATVQLAFRVAPEQVQSCYEDLKAKQVEIVQPPQIIDRRVWKYWKHLTLFFKDPEGNLLEIYADIDIKE
jgi:lactoylglutathione lyase